MGREGRTNQKHLVQFQGLARDRMVFHIEEAEENGEEMPALAPWDDVDGDGIVYGDEITFEAESFAYDDGARALFKEDEGWQHTVWVEPGQRVTIAATFDKPGEFVWHCHILSHEDHDMMRPLIVEEAEAIA